MWTLLQSELENDVWSRALAVLVDLGAKGLALKIFADRMGQRLKNLDPLEADNLIVLMPGVLAGTGGTCSFPPPSWHFLEWFLPRSKED